MINRRVASFVIMSMCVAGATSMVGAQSLPLGACCLFAGPGGCSDGETLESCEARPGVFLGVGTTCASDGAGCEAFFGACCISDFLGGGCDDGRTQVSCESGFGYFLGAGTTCADDGADCADGLGACCVPAPLIPTCNNGETELVCDAFFDGVFLGVGTTCGGANCPAELGACCLAIAGCGDSRTLESCEGSNGVFLGVGTTCATSDCTPILGACCTFGECRDDRTPLRCESELGTFLGGGTTCATSDCGPVTGACCVPEDDGGCLDGQTLASCEGTFLKGVFLGVGTTCATDGGGCAAVRGACCVLVFVDPGLCLDGQTPASCESTLGSFLGAGTSFAGGECAGRVGACCAPNGCFEIDQEICGVVGGVPLGAGTSCADLSGSCASFTGACCIAGGECLDSETEASCAQRDFSTFLGPGTTCADGDCEVGACCALDVCTFTYRGFCEQDGDLFVGAGTTCSDANCAVSNQPKNWIDNGIQLTANQPTWWSSATGLPAGVVPFPALDPDAPPGRPAMDGTTDRVLRGYVLAWAVDNQAREIRWNHLKGEGTIVNYRDQKAWEYSTYNYAVNENAAAHGALTGSPGVLRLNGIEYARSFDQLLLNFQAAGSTGWSYDDGVTMYEVESDTDLTLLVVPVDLRQNNQGSVTTKASFLIWNENEIKFSSTHRCITCWDQQLVSRYDNVNSFLRTFLQTDHGKAQIDGHAANICNVLDDPDTPENEGVTSVGAPMLGVSARHLAIDGQGMAAAGSNLWGFGHDGSATVRYDVQSVPGEASFPSDSSPESLLDWLEREFGIETSPSGADAGDPPAAAATGGDDRVSTTTKGSLLIYPKVEIRWDMTGKLVQDTILSLTNDYPDNVRIKLYFIEGDPPEDP